MVPWNLDRAEAPQMGRHPLRVEERETADAQMLDEGDERNFRCIRCPMKHRFAEEGRA